MLFIIIIFNYLVYVYNAEEECKRNFSVRRNSIILTKASQSKGASFIHKQVVSIFSECFSLCCSNADCTVAVYENKVNHECFMFNCKIPNVCLFTEHEDYISLLHIPRHESSPTKSNIKQSIIKSKEHVHPSMDAALGETCGVMRKCGPANSMCTSGTCICQIGYIGKSELCVRSLCPKPELMFQCVDVSKSPFCIALYDQCNGITECGDSSDEVNCEPNQYRRPIFNETSNRKMSLKVKQTSNLQRKVIKVESTLDNPQRNYQKDSHAKNLNFSSHYPIPHKTKYRENDKSQKNNPLAENQLLLLEAKNKPPKYPRRPLKDRSKPRHQYQKASTPPENNPLYEKHKYSNYKVPNYQREYDQKGEPDQSDISNRWNNVDSTSNDYEYPQMSSNSRDSNSDWTPDQYSEPSYPEAPERPSSDRSNYMYYPEEDDESYIKPRGRYISDRDRYHPKYTSHNDYEQSMDYGDRRKELQNKHKSPEKVDVPIMTTVLPQPNVHKILDDSSDRNMSEWSTAVIALSVGLLITAGLLIAVGFKMRTWRKRLRNGKKGKCLTTDEGDYLINGMYL